jgi:hypothetical protein
MSPIEDEVMPFPTPEITPPTTKIYFVFFIIDYLFKYFLAARKDEIIPNSIPDNKIITKI